MKNKKLISGLLIWLGISFVIVHAIYKLSQSDWMDLQHWGVLIAGIMLVIGNIIRMIR